MMGTSEHFVVFFNKTSNEYLQNKQLDIHVRLWNNSEVTTRHVTSAFMDYSTADDLFKSLTEALVSFPMSKMDGLNVNWSLFHKFQQCMKKKKKDFQVQCLDIGSCGLHTVQNAYKAGMHATGRPVDTYLFSLVSLFLDAPASWIENVPVLETALATWEHLKQAMSGRRLLVPKCRAYENVSAFLNDELELAKLNFSLNVGMVVQPFLAGFQTDSLKTFLLAKERRSVLRSLLSRHPFPNTTLCTCFDKVPEYVNFIQRYSTLLDSVLDSLLGLLGSRGC
ncbi:hypothetical protein HPB51_005155 [Rhipicephalus microplus]|uniref:Uncharacterized protein n=1 Tax=Rhipicephalus microplus TaxID=6941 RepID=A0A9J6DLG7_RHIMP|nr:hypothetical protein HPB51_005155 [Rhipicephalus microplus]